MLHATFTPRTQLRLASLIVKERATVGCQHCRVYNRERLRTAIVRRSRRRSADGQYAKASRAPVRMRRVLRAVAVAPELGPEKRLSNGRRPVCLRRRDWCNVTPAAQQGPRRQRDSDAPTMVRCGALSRTEAAACG